MKAIVVLLAAVLVLGACARKMVNPVHMQEEKRVCIIENPRVKFDFLGAYRRALEERGFQVEVWQETAQPSICPVTSRYTGNYRWDMWVYLAYGEILVYRDGQPTGRAVYTARNSRTGAESVIKDMVNDLFKN